MRPPPRFTLFPYTTLFRSKLVMVHTRGRQAMIEPERSRLEQILAKHGQRWQIEREGPVWTATEHPSPTALHVRSEEHTSELQSLRHLVCRLLLEKKKEQIK